MNFLRKKLFSFLLLTGTTASFLSANEKETTQGIGIVNFTSCITESKLGKKEQEALEGIRNQLTSLIKDIEDQLTDVTNKLNDTDYLDGLSPEGEQELKMKYQSLREEHDRYQGQFYQVMQQANMKLVQTISSYVNTATDKIAKLKKLSLVVNKDACFSFNDSFDITHEVINEMDKAFEALQQQNAKEIAKAASPSQEPIAK
ncbi:MAG: OmpH family outer membrane protein [Chlamydiae bacterium]|nr:OmpH family outer membrane protein [Chlamydiota bacterium]